MNSACMAVFHITCSHRAWPTQCPGAAGFRMSLLHPAGSCSFRRTANTTGAPRSATANTSCVTVTTLCVQGHTSGFTGLHHRDLSLAACRQRFLTPPLCPDPLTGQGSGCPREVQLRNALQALLPPHALLCRLCPDLGAVIRLLLRAKPKAPDSVPGLKLIQNITLQTTKKSHSLFLARTQR